MFKMLEVIFKIILIYLDIYIQYIYTYIYNIYQYIYIYMCIGMCRGIWWVSSEFRSTNANPANLRGKGLPSGPTEAVTLICGGSLFRKNICFGKLSPHVTSTYWHHLAPFFVRVRPGSAAESSLFFVFFFVLLLRKKNAMDHILENPGDPTTPNDQKWRKNSKRTTIVGLWDALCIHCEIVNSCFLVILAEWDSCSKIFTNDRSLSPCLCPFSPPRSCGKMWMISSKSTSAELGFLRGLKFKIEVRNGPEDFLPRLARRSSLLQPLLLVLLVFVFPLAIWLVNWDHHHLSHWINQGMDKLKAVEDLNATNKHQQTFTSFSA